MDLFEKMGNEKYPEPKRIDFPDTDKGYEEYLAMVVQNKVQRTAYIEGARDLAKYLMDKAEVAWVAVPSPTKDVLKSLGL